jgi:hypothetical protein
MRHNNSRPSRSEHSHGFNPALNRNECTVDCRAKIELLKNMNSGT